jgi:hypothetical protein
MNSFLYNLVLSYLYSESFLWFLMRMTLQYVTIFITAIFHDSPFINILPSVTSLPNDLNTRRKFVKYSKKQMIIYYWSSVYIYN